MPLRVQINDYDSYQTHPSVIDTVRGVVQVPVVRVYGLVMVPGPDPFPVNVLVHVHNVYPYVMVDCFREYTVDEWATVRGKLIAYIEKALWQSFQRTKEDDDDIVGEPGKRRYVASVDLCRGTPAYGFRVGELLVYRISVLSPVYKTRLVRVLEKGLLDDFERGLQDDLKKPEEKVDSQRCLYEAHIPHILQFLADFNLYGCSWLDILRCGVRAPVLNSTVSCAHLSALKSFLSRYISNNILDRRRFERIGKLALEVDISTGDIGNRAAIVPRALHHRFAEWGVSQPPQIYLSSLHHVHEDLRFQCARRNALASLPSQLQSSQHGAGTPPGLDPDLAPLLDYAVRLNGPTTSRDPAHYYATHMAAKQKRVAHFPSCFDFIDKTKSLWVCADVEPWSNYDELFDAEKPSQAVNPPSPPPLTRLPVSPTTPPPTTPPPKSPVTPPPSSPASTPAAPLSPIEVLSPSSNPFIDTTSPVAPTQLQAPLDDSHMLALTQRHRQLATQVQVPSSVHEAVLSHPRHVFEISQPPVLQKEALVEDFHARDLLKVNYPDPSYDTRADVPTKALVFGNKRIPVPYVNDVPPFSPLNVSVPQEVKKRGPLARNLVTFQYGAAPPSRSSIISWLNHDEQRLARKRQRFASQIEPGVTQTNDYKFSYDSNKVERDPNLFNALSNFYLEVHVNTSGDKLPDPEHDAVSMMFYKFDSLHGAPHSLGLLVLDPGNKSRYLALAPFLDNAEPTRIEVFCDEHDMATRLLDLVSEFDPDILSGYEVNSSSWGYLLERFRCAHSINLLPELSRCTYKSNGKLGDRWGYTHTLAIRVNGRHVLNLWRILRKEVNLTSYSLLNVSYHLLHQTLPKYTNLQLSQWVDGTFKSLLTVVKYYQKRILLALKIMYVQEIIVRNVEQSRIIGVDFDSNFYRGSQFKVESILLRIAKAENLLLNSPGKQDVHEMRAIECIPLIMEPDSGFYKSPLAVLDFQSLYPSVMIAYNYCYTTLLGKLHGFKQTKNHIGYLKNLDLPPGMLDLLRDHINVLPNGFMFVKSTVKKSLLSKMLGEILHTRIMVKSMMKLFGDDKELTKLNNLRQLALKLIANVTYGYTLATFSGRMPNSDIADAIVSTGREILANSIEMIEKGDYGAKVVYGDTDSLFVYFPGKSKADAFRLGQAIADNITNAFPDPIKLKFEKVYHPCVLLAKKRYVGLSYEHENQTEPKFDAKGIETIRRDGIPAQAKMVEKCLRILFTSNNLSEVKRYAIRHFLKVIGNRVSIKDFCFAKEVRHGTYKSEQHLPPGAILANKNIDKDPRLEPQYRERIPYVVIRDSTKVRIKDRCVLPEEFVDSWSTAKPLSLDHEYYITRVLMPPLERIFNLLGVDIKPWYRELPRLGPHALEESDIVNVAHFIRYNSCLHCGKQVTSYTTHRYLCAECVARPQELFADVYMGCRNHEQKVLAAYESCRNCVGTNFGVGVEYASSCVNNDCVVYYDKIKRLRAAQHARANRAAIADFEW